MSDENPYPPDILSYWLKIFISSTGRVYVLGYKLNKHHSKTCLFFLSQENLSVSCVIKQEIMLPLYNDQMSLLTPLAIIPRSSL